MTLDRETVAYHEAGHTVVGWKMGLGPPASVTIRQAGSSLGRTKWPPDDSYIDEAGQPNDSDPGARKRIVGHLHSSLGGPAAEEKHTGILNDDGAADDFVIVADLALCLAGTPEAAQKLVDGAREFVAQTVAANWPAIEAVAGALLERETLTPDDVRALIAPDGQ